MLLAQLGCEKLWKETDARTQAERVASRRLYVNFLLVWKKPFGSASLFTSFYNCGVIEGSFARIKTSVSDLSIVDHTLQRLNFPWPLSKV